MPTVRLRRCSTPQEPADAEPHAGGLAVPDGTTGLGLAEAVLASGYLPEVPGGAVWMLAGGRHGDPLAIIDPRDGSLTAVWGDRELRAPYEHHLTVHPGASVEDLRRQVVQGPWDGPGRRPPRTSPDAVRVGLTRSSVAAGDDMDAPHHRTLDLPAGAVLADLAGWALGRYGASVDGGSVWLLHLSERPVAVLTRAASGPPVHGHDARMPADAVLLDSVLMVGRGEDPVSDGADAHLEYRLRESPFRLLDEARRGVGDRHDGRPSAS